MALLKTHVLRRFILIISLCATAPSMAASLGNAIQIKALYLSSDLARDSKINPEYSVVSDANTNVELTINSYFTNYWSVILGASRSGYSYSSAASRTLLQSSGSLSSGLAGTEFHFGNLTLALLGRYQSFITPYEFNSATTELKVGHGTLAMGGVRYRLRTPYVDLEIGAEGGGPYGSAIEVEKSPVHFHYMGIATLDLIWGHGGQGMGSLYGFSFQSTQSEFRYLQDDYKQTSQGAGIFLQY